MPFDEGPTELPCQTHKRPQNITLNNKLTGNAICTTTYVTDYTTMRDKY